MPLKIKGAAFSGYVYDKLPQVYKSADEEQNLTLRKYFEAVNKGFNAAITDITDLHDALDPVKCPSRLFPNLYESFGLPYFHDIPEVYQRKIAGIIGELYIRKGTKGAVEYLAKEITGLDAEVLEWDFHFKTWNPDFRQLPKDGYLPSILSPIPTEQYGTHLADYDDRFDIDLESEDNFNRHIAGVRDVWIVLISDNADNLVFSIDFKVLLKLFGFFMPFDVGWSILLRLTYFEEWNIVANTEEKFWDIIYEVTKDQLSADFFKAAYLSDNLIMSPTEENPYVVVERGTRLNDSDFVLNSTFRLNSLPYRWWDIVTTSFEEEPRVVIADENIMTDRFTTFNDEGIYEISDIKYLPDALVMPPVEEEPHIVAVDEITSSMLNSDSKLDNQFILNILSNKCWWDNVYILNNEDYKISDEYSILDSVNILPDKEEYKVSDIYNLLDNVIFAPEKEERTVSNDDRMFDNIITLNADEYLVSSSDIQNDNVVFKAENGVSLVISSEDLFDNVKDVGKENMLRPDGKYVVDTVKEVTSETIFAPKEGILDKLIFDVENETQGRPAYTSADKATFNTEKETVNKAVESFMPELVVAKDTENTNKPSGQYLVDSIKESSIESIAKPTEKAADNVMFSAIKLDRKVVLQDTGATLNDRINTLNGSFTLNPFSHKDKIN